MSNSEQIGWIPRSIIRTFQRFFKQIGFQTDLFAIYEFRVSRYFAIASLQCFFFLILCPWIFQFFMKFFVFKFLEEFSTPVFLNFHQQEQALEQLNNLDAQIDFDTLLNSKIHQIEGIPPDQLGGIWPLPPSDWISQTADFYLKQSLGIITNWILDLTTLLFFFFLLFLSKPQITIFKTF
ncbi:hypothetical protein, partial [Escherichia coli]|uniref:hypothetical protein n=1 Tax=Escherichia coli TaxID=562 RepID=UPI003B9C4CDA